MNRQQRRRTARKICGRKNRAERGYVATALKQQAEDEALETRAAKSGLVVAKSQLIVP